MRLSRRTFLGATGAVAGWIAARRGAATVQAYAADSGVAHPEPHERRVIVNADDFGQSPGIERGVIEAHTQGVVTSASVLVDGIDAEEAARLGRQHPALSLGVHVDLLRSGRRVDLGDLGAVRREIDRQINGFVRLTGHPPTHVDSHHHVHREFNIAYPFLEVSRHYGVPLRGFSEVVYVGRFYGQRVAGRTDTHHISVDCLIFLLRSAPPGVSEISCHPGHPDPRSDPDYNREREIELHALVDPRVKAAAVAERIELVSYRDYRRTSGRRPAEALSISRINLSVP